MTSVHFWRIIRQKDGSIITPITTFLVNDQRDAKFLSTYLLFFKLSTCLEHIVLETCPEFKIKIQRKQMCVTLVIYHESLHDARSLEYKKSQPCWDSSDTETQVGTSVRRNMWQIHLFSPIYILNLMRISTGVTCHSCRLTTISYERI